MASLSEWARQRLGSAPAGSCAFWIDLGQELQGGNDGFADRDEQTLRDSRGREWQVLRYRANPFAARRALIAGNGPVLVWCTGTPGERTTDLTPFEDLLGSAHHILDASLAAFARERAPGLEVPHELGRILRDAPLEPEALIAAIERRRGRNPVTLPQALNAAVEEVAGVRGGIDTATPARVLATAAAAYAGTRDEAGEGIVRVTLRALADGEMGRDSAVSTLAAASPAMVVGMAHIGSALTRLGVKNAGAALVAEGVCARELRDALEADRGTFWVAVDEALGGRAQRLAEWYEGSGEALPFERLRRCFAESAPSAEAACAEAVPMVRLAALSAAVDGFVASTATAAGSELHTGRWADGLKALDAVAAPLRLLAAGRLEEPPKEAGTENIARAFVSSRVNRIEVSLVLGRLSLATAAQFVPADSAIALRQRLEVAEREYLAAIDGWDHDWASAIDGDVRGFLEAPLQSWRRAARFAEGAKAQRWLLVFDGLRHDLWTAVLRPALEGTGLRVDGDDYAFSYLPSITEVARRVLVGGDPSAAGLPEPSVATRLADRAGVRHSYQLKAESFRAEQDTAEAGWNVRVFSWPDKQVHSDVMDMGTLVNQFSSWVNAELVPWVRNNLAKAERVAVSADHGFVALDPLHGVDVGREDGEDRNLPRVAHGRLPSGVPVVKVGGGGQQVSLAASRAWFRRPGGRSWRFAHGGATLRETLVPFAELVPAQLGQAEAVFTNLPSSITLREGETQEMIFTVTVTGGRVRHPALEVTGGTGNRSLTLGQTEAVHVTITGAEGLNSVIIRVRADRRLVREEVVKVNVELAKVKRTTLDLDF